MSDIDYLTNSIKLSGIRKISFDPYLKTDEEIIQRNSLLYYIKCTSPVQNKKINYKTTRIFKSYNQKKPIII